MKAQIQPNLFAADRRIFNRMRFTFPLTYRLKIDNLLYRAYCHDVGPGGIGILTDKKLDIDAKIDLWLESKDSQEPLLVSGKVVWARWEQTSLYRTYRAGLQFDNIKLFNLNLNKLTDNA